MVNEGHIIKVQVLIVTKKWVVITVNSLLTYTSIRRTLRVGPCLSLLPLFDSL